MRDVVVIGAGLSGLVSAIKCARAGASVTLVTKGIGGIQLGQGTVDVLGYTPELVTDPLAAVEAYGQAHPNHPYATLGRDAVAEGARALAKLVPDLLTGDLSRNYLLPTAVGALRPTALPQFSMLAGELKADEAVVFVGLRQLKDFWPELIAGNVGRTDLPGGGRAKTRAAWIDLPAREGEVDSTPLTYARSLDDKAYRHRFIAALKAQVKPGEKVGLPAVLGYSNHQVWREIQDALGNEVFEIPTIPPSIPGMRINQALKDIAHEERVRFVLGSAVTGAVTEGKTIKSVTVATTGRPTEFKAKQFIFAPGGFESGAIAVDSYIKVSEPALGLPVWVPEGQLIVAEHDAEQPLFTAGVRFDDKQRAIDANGEVVYENLRVAGGILAGASRWREKSGEGIALASAVRAADMAIGSK